MKKMTRKQVIIATSCQRYYSLGLHIHLFRNEYSSSSLFGPSDASATRLRRLWLYIGNLS